MFITELDVINDCLSSLGESPINAIDEEHPLVASALRNIRVVSTREQAKGWWFNRERVVLYPDPTTGFVFVPADTINIDPVKPWLHYTQRGRRLYDPRPNRGYVINEQVVCNLLRRLPFEDLPALAQSYISLAVQQEFQKAYDADTTKYRQIVADKQEAYLVLRAEDIRNAGVNLLHKPSTAIRADALGLYGDGQRGLSANYNTDGLAGSPPTPPAFPVPTDVPVPDFTDIFEDNANG